MARCQDRRTASALRTRWMGTGCILLPAPGQAHSNPPSITPQAPSSLSLLSPKPFSHLHPWPSPRCPAAQQAPLWGTLSMRITACLAVTQADLPHRLIPGLGTPAAHMPSWHQQPQRDLLKSRHYLSESRSYLSRFLSGESICWNFSLRSFPLSLCLPFVTERTK